MVRYKYATDEKISTFDSYMHALRQDDGTTLILISDILWDKILRAASVYAEDNL